MLWFGLFVLISIQFLCLIQFESNGTTLALFKYRPKAWGNPSYIFNAFHGMSDLKGLLYSPRYSYFGLWIILLFHSVFLQNGWMSMDQWSQIKPHDMEGWSSFFLYPLLLGILFTGLFYFYKNKWTRNLKLPCGVYLIWIIISSYLIGILIWLVCYMKSI